MFHAFAARCLVLCLLGAVAATQPPGHTPFRRFDGDRNRVPAAAARGPQPALGRLYRNGARYIGARKAAGTLPSDGPPRFLGGGSRRAPAAAENGVERSVSELLYVDTHNHLVGPVGGGVTRQFDFDSPARAALETMNAQGVKLNLVMPMPQGLNQQHRLYLDDILPVVQRYPGRFAVLGGGGTLNVLIQRAVQEGTVTGSLREEFDATAARIMARGAVGFGEMAAEHLSMRPDHPYISAPPDHPLFLHLADLAARYDVPVDIHMEAVPEEMPLPPRLPAPPNPTRLTPNIHAFERLLAHNRKARIVWAHLGWDNTGRRTVALTRRLLSAHSNLYISLRVASGMQSRNVVSTTFPLDRQSRLKTDWRVLFEQFPDRFFIGSDEIIQAGNRHPSAGSIRSTVDLLRQLPPELREKFGYANAYRVYRLNR